MDEKDLVRRCSAGNPGARQEMYETYAGRVLAVCRRYVRDAARARDLTHDTFLKAWDSLGRFRPWRAGSLGAWLCQIAAHLSVDELRRERRFVEITDPVRSEGRSRDDAAGTGPEEAAIDPDRLRQIPVEELIDLVASLPEGYRAVFNLFCLDGYSHREIARMLGITEKTSQTQYLKARRRLAAMIVAKYGNDDEEK